MASINKKTIYTTCGILLLILATFCPISNALIPYQLREYNYYDNQGDWSEYVFDIYQLRISEMCADWFEIEIIFKKPTNITQVDPPEDWGIFYLYFDINDDGVPIDYGLRLTLYSFNVTNRMYYLDFDEAKWVNVPDIQWFIESESNTSIVFWLNIDYLIANGFSRDLGFNFYLQAEWNEDQNTRSVTDELGEYSNPESYEFYVFTWIDYLICFFVDILNWIINLVTNLVGLLAVAFSALSSFGVMLTKHRKGILAVGGGFIGIPTIAFSTVAPIAGIAVFILFLMVVCIFGFLGFLAGTKRK
jgi:hypothetical protein